MEVSVSVSDAGGRSFSLAVPVEGGDTLAALNKVREQLNDALTGMVADSDAAADLPDPETLGSDDEKELEKEIAALERPSKKTKQARRAAPSS